MNQNMSILWHLQKQYDESRLTHCIALYTMILYIITDTMGPKYENETLIYVVHCGFRPLIWQTKQFKYVTLYLLAWHFIY